MGGQAAGRACGRPATIPMRPAGRGAAGRAGGCGCGGPGRGHRLRAANARRVGPGAPRAGHPRGLPCRPHPGGQAGRRRRSAARVPSCAASRRADVL